MKANTIKLEEDILSEINSVRPKQISLSAFVRELIRKEITRRKMIAAAEEYEEYVNSHPKLKEEMLDWEKADLTR